MIRDLIDRIMPARAPSTADEWLARAKSRRFDERQRQQLKKWLAQDPRNHAEYERCNRLSDIGIGLRARADLVKAMPIYAELAQTVERPRLGIRWVMAGAAAATCALLAIWLVPHWSQPEQPITVATRLGEQREISLEDGTKIHLNTDSAVHVAFTDSERRVRLDGEGFFDVARDASGRPFIVDAGTTEIRVVGTRFSVRTTDHGTQIIVAEGKVEVVPDRRGQSPSTPAKIELVPGNALRFDRRENYVYVAAVDPERATAWRTGTIGFENATVEEVIAEVNRYSQTPFVIADPEGVRHIRMSGSFKVGDTEAVRFVLKNGYGIESSIEAAGIVLR